MKIIFDYDDTLSNTKKLREQTFLLLEKAGISQEKADVYYKEIRSTDVPFSLKHFIVSIYEKEQIQSSWKEVYEGTMNILPELVKPEMLDIAKSAGAENCYIVTNGDFEFQTDKITRSGIAHFFHQITVVPGSKKEIIEEICVRYPNEKVVYVDDKERFFSDLDMDRCKNLITVLFNENGLEKLKQAITIAK